MRRGHQRERARRGAASRFLGYTDYVYRRDGGALYADRAFALFLVRVGREFAEARIAGRLAPEPGRAHYRLPPGVRLAAMPHYAIAADPVAIARALVGSVRRFGALLRDADVVWLLGPHPLQVPLVLLGVARGRRVALGVRQDMRAYVRSRHPDRRWIHVAGDALEGIWRVLAWRLPVVVVGDDLARKYRHARRLLSIAVSLVREEDLASAEEAERDYGGEIRVLSVGRLETEKNPLLLADVLAELRRRDPRFRLVVCGEGPLTEALAERLRELGVEEHAELLGYVPLDGGLLDVYRASHVFLHVSLTEGLPQVLLEAFATRLPVVATDVGGVRAAAEGASVLIGPADAAAAADAVGRVVADPELRRSITEAGAERARSRTMDAEARRVAAFLSE